jgi:hypothetical protein
VASNTRPPVGTTLPRPRNRKVKFTNDPPDIPAEYQAPLDQRSTAELMFDEGQPIKN